MSMRRERGSFIIGTMIVIPSIMVKWVLQVRAIESQRLRNFPSMKREKGILDLVRSNSASPKTQF